MCQSWRSWHTGRMQETCSENQHLVNLRPHSSYNSYLSGDEVRVRNRPNVFCRRPHQRPTCASGKGAFHWWSHRQKRSPWQKIICRNNHKRCHHKSVKLKGNVKGNPGRPVDIMYESVWIWLRDHPEPEMTERSPRARYDWEITPISPRDHSASENIQRRAITILILLWSYSWW